MIFEKDQTFKNRIRSFTSFDILINFVFIFENCTGFILIIFTPTNKSNICFCLKQIQIIFPYQKAIRATATLQQNVFSIPNRLTHIFCILISSFSNEVTIAFTVITLISDTFLWLDFRIFRQKKINMSKWRWFFSSFVYHLLSLELNLHRYRRLYT